MNYLSIGILETNVIDIIKTNNGVTFDDILNKTGISQSTLVTLIEALIAKGTIIQQTNDNEEILYTFRTTIDRPIMLDGNIFLPVSVIEFPEKGTKLVSRGNWYELPIDFDIDRIIWNVAIDTKQKSTLAELIATSVTKERTSKNVQLPEYAQLQNKEVPYSPNFNLLLKIIGETLTDVTIKFKIPVFLTKLTDDIVVPLFHSGFNVHTKISTSELLAELRRPSSERDYNNIKLNRLFNITDFIFAGNEFPYEHANDGLLYAKITGIRNGFELTYIKMTTNGVRITMDKEQYDDVSMAVSKISQLFESICSATLEINDMNCDFIE